MAWQTTYPVPPEQKSYNTDLHINIGNGVAGQVARTRQPLLVSNAEKDEVFSNLGTQVSIKSVLCMPLISNDELLGILNLSRSQPRAITQNHERLFAILADLVANLLHRTLLSEAMERRARDELQKAEFREAMLDLGVSDLIILFDRSGEITYCNTTVANLLGTARQNLEGVALDALPILDESSALRHREAIQRAAAGQVVDPYDVILHLRDETPRTIEFRLSVVREKDNGDSGLLAVGRDTTERKRWQAQMMRAEKLLSLGTLASGVAHEILNPLHIISVGAQLLETDDSDPQIRNETYVTISEQVERISRIVHGIKAFTQSQGTKVETTGINDVILQALDLVSPEFRRRGIRVNHHLMQGLPLVSIDRDQFMQVFVNMFTNARDSMPTGGELRISTRVESQESSPKVIVEISDTGDGIPLEIQQRIFDPFFTTKEVERRAGLGLAICHGIITEHGGALDVESSGDSGATFTVFLPIADASDHASQST